jgi:choline dehydrogenase-like flavoprotein
MLLDLEAVSTPILPIPTASVCIAGAGIAGLVLACALADNGISVTLLEAGGRRHEDRSQILYDAEMTATRHTGTTEGRFRVFGGSSVRWGGQLLPYTDDIFSPDSGLGSSGWPITAAALEPFYSKVEAILGADHLPFSMELYRTLGMRVPADFESNPNINLRFSKWAPFSHRNVARTLGEKAIASDRITVVLHANTTECLLSPNGSRIEALLAQNYQRRCFRFEAERYVLATETIETSRLLLASRSVCPNGVGNDGNQVGTKLHDHVSAAVADLDGEARVKLLSWLGPFFTKQTTHTARLE